MKNPGMAETGQSQLDPFSRQHITPLTTASDFCDFQTSGIRERSSSGEELNSDIEDAIYANMYFTTSIPTTSYQNRLEEKRDVLFQNSPGTERSGNINDLPVPGWDISLCMSSPHQSPSPTSLLESKDNAKDMSKSKNSKGKDPLTLKGKRNHSKKWRNRQSKKSHLSKVDNIDIVTIDSAPTDVVAIETDPLDVITINSDTPDSDPDANLNTTNSSVKSKVNCLSGSTNSTEKNRSPSLSSRRTIHLKEQDDADLQSPVNDIKKLFKKGKATKLVKPVSNEEPIDFIVITDSSDEGSDKADDIASSNEPSTEERSSSLESGELAGSGSRSRANSSDMDISSGGGGGEEEEVEVDPWRVNEKDRLGRDAYERLHGEEDSIGRYYGKRNTKCPNCKQRGHNGKTCPWPKRHTVCYLCAGHHHISSSCPQSLCTYCYRKKHRGVTCRVPWAGLGTTCTRCYMKGHHASICPDLWRQYHHTTYESHHMVTIPGNQQRRKDKIYCSNCSQEGHFGFECTRSCPKGNPSHHLPLVAYYDTALWPPRDQHSLNIIHNALAKQTNHMAPDPVLAREDLGVKRTLSMSEEVDTLITPQRKKRKTNAKRRNKEPTEMSPNVSRKIHSPSKGPSSLLITVDGRQDSRASLKKHNSTYSRSVLDRVSPSLHTNFSRFPSSPSPTSTTGRSSHFASPSLPTTSHGNFPREPHNHIAYGDSRRGSIPDKRGYPEDYGYHKNWSHDSGHPQGARHQYRRTFSTELDLSPNYHSYSNLPHRRYSEHLEHHPARHNSSYSATPTSTPNRHHQMSHGIGGGLRSNRGFRMSEEIFQQSGYSHGHQGTSSEGRRHRRGYPRY